MKKIIILAITVAIALCFSSCIKIETRYVNTTKEPGTNVNTELNTTEFESQFAEELEQIVEINVPASMFDENNPPSDKLSEEQIYQGLKSAKINDDGSVTYTMSKDDSIMSTIVARRVADDSIKNLTNSYSFVKAVDYEVDYSCIRLRVDEQNYNKDEIIESIEEMAYSVNMYHIFANEEVSCTVEIYDNSGENLIESLTYPQ